MPQQPLESLHPGLTLEADVLARNGRFLLSKGRELSSCDIEALYTWGVEAVPVMNGASPPAPHDSAPPGRGLEISVLPCPFSTTSHQLPPDHHPLQFRDSLAVSPFPTSDRLHPGFYGQAAQQARPLNLTTLARRLPQPPTQDDQAARIAYLEQAQALSLFALEQATNLGDFHGSITRKDKPQRILSETRKRIHRLVGFQATGLFLMNEEDSRFSLSLSEPEQSAGFFDDLLRDLVRGGRIAEMIWNRCPIMVAVPGANQQCMVHLISTTARVRGLFMGLLAEEDLPLPQEATALLANVLQNAANALESSQLYALITRHNQELQARVEARTAKLRQTVSALKQEIAQRRIVQVNLAAVFHNVHDAILIYQPDGRIIDVNEKMLAMFGVNQAHAMDLNVPRDISCTRRSDDQCFDIWDMTHAGESSIFEWTVHAPGNGANFPVEVFLKRITWNDQPSILATLRDISQRKEAEKKLEFLALHDPLTGIPNRKLFLERLDQAISQARRNLHMAAVLFIDLDGFKPVNDTHGHDVGDGVLVAVAKRLRLALRKSDTVARLGGDEFGVVITDLFTDTDHHRVMDKVYETIRQPISLNGISLNLDCSIGAALFPASGDTVDALIKTADTEMYGVKRGKR
jgi:diguanylate cyclase (GGDEF)-like protein/PAS domain S-box-containing protein